MLLLVVTVFHWQSVAACMTGPDPQERFGIRSGVNVSRKFDYDGDGDLDLRDVAEFMNRMNDGNDSGD